MRRFGDNLRKSVIKHIFIITNTMHTIGVDKITLFKTHLKQRIIYYILILCFRASQYKSNENTNLMQHCAGFISAGSLYMFRALAPIIRSI